MMIHANNPIVALDVDGVLGDFESHWADCAREFLGRPMVRVNEQHSLSARYGLTTVQAEHPDSLVEECAVQEAIDRKAVDAILEVIRKLGVRVVLAKSDLSVLIHNHAIQEQRNERN